MPDFTISYRAAVTPETKDVSIENFDRTKSNIILYTNKQVDVNSIEKVVISNNLAEVFLNIHSKDEKEANFFDIDPWVLDDVLDSVCPNQQALNWKRATIERN